MWVSICWRCWAEMWTHFTEGLTWIPWSESLVLLLTELPLFVLNQILNPLKWKNAHFVFNDLLKLNASHNQQGLWNWYLLRMSDFSHLFCFYPRLPTWSTWVSELRYHISHVSCLLCTCPALFIKALSAPGVCCQAGSGSFGLTSAAAVLEDWSTSQFIEQTGPAAGAANWGYIYYIEVIHCNTSMLELRSYSVEKLRGNWESKQKGGPEVSDSAGR